MNAWSILTSSKYSLSVFVIECFLLWITKNFIGLLYKTELLGGFICILKVLVWKNALILTIRNYELIRLILLICFVVVFLNIKLVCVEYMYMYIETETFVKSGL